MSMATDRAIYSRYSSLASSVVTTVNVGDSATLRGLPNVAVTITIYKPDNSVAYTGTGTTDYRGRVQFSFSLSTSSPTGTYLITATAELAGYQTGSGQRTFLVL